MEGQQGPRQTRPSQARPPTETDCIERFNATLRQAQGRLLRARLPSLVRRTRNAAGTVKRLEMELFWSGVVYNFCTVHTTLSGTPAMAAGITDEPWTIRRLLFIENT